MKTSSFNLKPRFCLLNFVSHFVCRIFSLFSYLCIPHLLLCVRNVETLSSLCCSQVKLVQHTYSCLFGTFLCNNAKERSEKHIQERTCSVWSLLRAGNRVFKNLLYSSQSETVSWLFMQSCFYTVNPTCPTFSLSIGTTSLCLRLLLYVTVCLCSFSRTFCFVPKYSYTDIFGTLSSKETH